MFQSLKKLLLNSRLFHQHVIFCMCFYLKGPGLEMGLDMTTEICEVLGYTHTRFKKWATGLFLMVGDSANAHCKDESTPISETLVQAGMMIENHGLASF